MLTDAAAAGTGPRLFGKFRFCKRAAIIIAVSGGSDSLALLHLAKRHADRHAPSTRLLAVTVDHQLRPEAAGEARRVAALCESLDLTHRTMRWTGAKPATGIAEAARLARYALLAEAADEVGADLILTGHTLDDQAETVAMRQKRGAGYGLAGMAEATLFDDRVWIGRPLLGERRRALREMLVEAGTAWIDDPSNFNPAAERVRVRRQLEQETGAVERLAELAAEAAISRRRLGAAAAALLAEARLVSPGLVRVPLAAFDSVAPEAALHAFRILLAAMGGAPHLPASERSAALLASLRQGKGRATLAGALVDRSGGTLHMLREGRGLEPAELRPGEIWDGRFRLDRSAGPIWVRAAGPVGSPAGGLAALAACGEPVAEGGAECACPLLERVVSPWALFLPCFDIEARDAVARLLGAPLTPCWP